MRTLIVIAAAMLSAGAMAAEKTERVLMAHGAGRSVQHAALTNLVAPELATAAKRSADEVRAMLDEMPPPAVARELGLDREQMRAAMQHAHDELIQRMLGAQLLTAEQAETLRRGASKSELPPPPAW